MTATLGPALREHGATAPAMVARTADARPSNDSARPWRRAFALGVLGFALYVAVDDYVERLITAPGGHQVGDWLISYPGRFVRRGLFGELLLALTPPGAAALWLLLACQLVLYALVVAFVARFLSRHDWSWSAVALACSPAGVAFVGWDTVGGFRKEVIGLAVLVLLAFARERRGRGERALVGAALVLWAVAVLSWEPAAFMLPAVCYLLLAGRDSGPRRWAAAAFGGVGAAGLLASVAFPGEASTPQALCRAVTGHGLPPDLCGGAIAWMGRGTADSAALLREALPVHSAYLLLIPLAALPIVLSGWLRANWGWAALMTAATLPLFLLGVDYGRWLHLLFMQIAICMMTAAPRLIRSGQWTAVAAVLYASTWGIAHAQPVHDAPGWPFRGLLATGIELVQSTFLGTG